MTIQCKGSFVLGTACGYCHKCAQEASKLIPQYKAEIMGLYKDTAELAALKEENARLKAAAIGRGMVSEMADMTETAVLVCGLHDQLAAWKAEAMAARRVLGSAEWNDADFVAYMATRVKDGE